MAPLFASSHAAHASLLLLSPNPTAAARVRIGGLRVRRPRRLRLPVRLAAGAGTPDPTVDDDEWGREPPTSASANSQPSDEWGEPGVPEPEQPSGADTPTNDDEWGGEPTPTPAPAKAEEPQDSALEELKRCLADTVYGSGLGLQASAEVRGEVVELVAQLEAANPTTAPVQAPDLLDGNWILLYTAYSELLPILLAGATPFTKVEKISQEIDSRSLMIVNASTISTPFASFSFSATASFEAQSPSRIEAMLKDLQLQSSPSSSPLRSAELGTLQPWTKAGTRPLALGPGKPSTLELKKGLSTEVENSLELTGMEKAILAKDSSVSNMDAEEMLQAKQVLHLRYHPSSPPASSSPFRDTALEPEEESIRKARG